MAWRVNNTLYIFGSETAVLFDSSILLMNIFYSMNTDNSHVIMPFFVCSLYHCILIGTGDKVLTWHFMDLIKPISSLVCYYLWLEWFICHQKRIDYNSYDVWFLRYRVKCVKGQCTFQNRYTGVEIPTCSPMNVWSLTSWDH